MIYLKKYDYKYQHTVPILPRMGIAILNRPHPCANNNPFQLLIYLQLISTMPGNGLYKVLIFCDEQGSLGEQQENYTVLENCGFLPCFFIRL